MCQVSAPGAVETISSARRGKWRRRGGASCEPRSSSGTAAGTVMETLSGHCCITSWSNRGRSVPQIMHYLQLGENKKTKFYCRISISAFELNMWGGVIRHQVMHLFSISIKHIELSWSVWGDRMSRGTDTRDLEVRCVPNHIKIATLPVCRVKWWWLVFYNFYIDIVSDKFRRRPRLNSQSVVVLIGVFMRAFSKHFESFRNFLRHLSLKVKS